MVSMHPSLIALPLFKHHADAPLCVVTIFQSIRSIIRNEGLKPTDDLNGRVGQVLPWRPFADLKSHTVILDSE
jgi:hypothetical protein